jgi:hypothetical protein
MLERSVSLPPSAEWDSEATRRKRERANKYRVAPVESSLRYAVSQYTQSNVSDGDVTAGVARRLQHLPSLRKKPRLPMSTMSQRELQLQHARSSRDVKAATLVSVASQSKLRQSPSTVTSGAGGGAFAAGSGGGGSAAHDSKVAATPPRLQSSRSKAALSPEAATEVEELAVDGDAKVVPVAEGSFARSPTASPQRRAPRVVFNMTPARSLPSGRAALPRLSGSASHRKHVRRLTVDDVDTILQRASQEASQTQKSSIPEEVRVCSSLVSGM